MDQFLQGHVKTFDCEECLCNSIRCPKCGEVGDIEGEFRICRVCGNRFQKQDYHCIPDERSLCNAPGHNKMEG